MQVVVNDRLRVRKSNGASILLAISDLIKGPREHAHMPAASQRFLDTNINSFLAVSCIPSRHDDRLRIATRTSLEFLPESSRFCSHGHLRSISTAKHGSIMASLEPPIPANAAHVFESPLDRVASTQEQDTPSWNAKGSSWAKWRRSVGLLLLFVTVFLWTVSNFLASVRSIYALYDTLRS